jgi:LemA protein
MRPSMTAALIVILGLAALVAVALVLLYNRLVRLRNRTENAWSQVEVQLKRRYDLVPNLVETVKGYAAHEREVFDAVTTARSTAQGARGVEAQAAAEQGLSSALGRLFAVAEAYPQLRATENFQALQAQLAETENRIAVSRQIFNDTVQTYDTSVETFPSNLVAGAFGFTRKPFFELDDPAAAAPPAVSL